MRKRGEGISWATHGDRNTPFLDAASERSAGLMLSAFRSRWEDVEPAPFEQSLASDTALVNAGGTIRLDQLSSVASFDFPAVIDLATLDGTDGFRIDGIDASDWSGYSVASAGDVNGDGFDDIIIGAPRADPGRDGDAGESYIVFGKAGGFSASLDLGALNGSNGFRIDGIDVGDQSGYSVSAAGDVNGDGVDDIIIGASGGDSGRDREVGESYVVFGKADGFAASLDLATLDGSNGFRLEGIDASDRSGISVASAGDVNGDGFDDLIIGASSADPGGDVDAGESYVVFGKAGGFAANLDLAMLDGSNGFRLDGIDAGDRSGRSVSSAGDVNGDGFDDIVIGALGGGYYGAGESYVVFGKAVGFSPSLDLATLDGSDGFRLDGIDEYDRSGFSVSSAGDLNGDGFDDIIIGAYGGDPGGDTYAGESYVVFGRATGFPASFDLAALDGRNGFRIDGIDPGDQSGFSVSSAGDVNGDGFDDIIIGAFAADPGGDEYAGESYVVFGKASGFAATLDLASLDGADGFRLDGVDAFDRSGLAVSSAGDVNGDGFDDIVIGAPFTDVAGNGYTGETYVVFGDGPDESVVRIGSAADQTIRGGDFDDTLKGLRGDDILAGSGGRDRLKGGEGADDFVLASRDPEDRDKILDFGAVDRIALDGDAFGLVEGALRPPRFVIATEAQDANDRLIYDDATGKLFFDADGTGVAAQVLIATLTDAPMLAVGDFVVI